MKEETFQQQLHLAQTQTITSPQQDKKKKKTVPQPNHRTLQWRSSSSHRHRTFWGPASVIQHRPTLTFLPCTSKRSPDRLGASCGLVIMAAWGSQPVQTAPRWASDTRLITDHVNTGRPARLLTNQTSGTAHGSAAAQLRVTCWSDTLGSGLSSGGSTRTPIPRVTHFIWWDGPGRPSSRGWFLTGPFNQTWRRGWETKSRSFTPPTCCPLTCNETLQVVGFLTDRKHGGGFRNHSTTCSGSSVRVSWSCDSSLCVDRLH